MHVSLLILFFLSSMGNPRGAPVKFLAIPQRLAGEPFRK
jgi:hypothetical protein